MAARVPCDVSAHLIFIDSTTADAAMQRLIQPRGREERRNAASYYSGIYYIS